MPFLPRGTKYARVTERRFQQLALALLVATVAVIVWGAFVRVTGSGAGCADHWPLCNGELIPRAPKVQTLIEFTHRVTSGLAGLLTVVVFVYARKRSQPVRRAALAGLILMILEGAIGALLVKRGLVVKDASAERAFVVGLHLCNTFLLLAAQVLTLHFARGGAIPRWQPRALALGACTLIALCLGATGAITGLGDTLFPAASLQEGFAQDLSPGAHFLIRLRIWHPALAVLGGAVIVYVAQYLRGLSDSEGVARWAWTLTALYVLQLAVGASNLYFLAPAPIQLAHLFLADLVWLSLVMLSAHCLAERQVSLASAAS
ncbi:MAG TPA: COX15/CtaA family protein [Polyangiales bacterium]|nr:COX15/CtaA family protein [Polyangiales bacterium]